MSRKLPPNPSLTNLKKQAKSLLKSQKEGDHAICDTLRLLRRFSDVSDDVILAADVGLQEVQHALAKDYGFANWCELHDVVGAVPTKLTDRVKRKGKKVWIDQVEPFSETGWWCSELYCQAELGKLGGVEVTQDYLAGVTGAAFALVFHPEFCPSSPDMILGPADGSIAQRLVGFKVAGGAPEPDEQVRKSIVDSIDKGIPAVAYAGGGVFGLVVAHEEQGRKLYGRTFVDKATDYSPITDGPWFTRIMQEMSSEERGPVPSATELAAGSLRLALKVAYQEAWGDDYACGFKAFEVWAQGLLDDARFENIPEDSFENLRHANGWCYACVAPSRQAAMRYLRSIEVLFDFAVSKHILAAADLYEQVSEKLIAGKTHVPWKYPTDDGRITGLTWTKDMRHAQSATLTDCLALERQAIAEIDKALSAIE